MRSMQGTGGKLPRVILRRDRACGPRRLDRKRASGAVRRSGMDQKIINLYDRFTHGGMNRREFLDRLAELAGSAAAAAALLPLLQNDYAQAAIVPADDARLVAERASYDFAEGQDRRLSRAGEGQGQAPGGSRHPREPRPQSAPGGCGAAVRHRGLSRIRRRSAVTAGRHARQRGCRARAASEDESGRRGRGARLSRVVSRGARRIRPARSERSAIVSAA